MDIKIGDKVSVRWDETGRMFNATVQSIHMDVPWTFDVLYDEQVRGKPCVEKRVAMDRLKRFGSPSPSHRHRAPANEQDQVVIDDGAFMPDEDDFMETFAALDEDESAIEMYWGDAPPAALAAASTRTGSGSGVGSAPGSATKRKGGSSGGSGVQTVLQYLSQLRDEGDAVQQVDLTVPQILQLHEVLTPALIGELMDSTGGRSTLELAARCLSDALQHTDVDTAFDNAFQASGVESVGGWLGASGKGTKQFGLVRAALAAGATLMRLLGQCGSELDGTVLSEEQVERAVGLCQTLLVDNALMPGMGRVRGGAEGEKGKGKGKGKNKEDEEGGLEAMVTVGKSKFKVKQTTRRLLSEAGKAVCPLLAATLRSLEGLMLARRQGDRLCVAVYEVWGG